MLAVRQMGGVAGGVPAQTLDQKKKLLWGAKKAESVQMVRTPLVGGGFWHVPHSRWDTRVIDRQSMLTCAVAAGLQAAEQGMASGVNRWDAAEFTSDNDRAKFQQLMVRCPSLKPIRHSTAHCRASTLPMVCSQKPWLPWCRGSSRFRLLHGDQRTSLLGPNNHSPRSLQVRGLALFAAHHVC